MFKGMECNLFWALTLLLSIADRFSASLGICTPLIGHASCGRIKRQSIVDARRVRARTAPCIRTLTDQPSKISIEVGLIREATIGRDPPERGIGRQH